MLHSYRTAGVIAYSHVPSAQNSIESRGVTTLGPQSPIGGTGVRLPVAREHTTR